MGFTYHRCLQGNTWWSPIISWNSHYTYFKSKGWMVCIVLKIRILWTVSRVTSNVYIFFFWKITNCLLAFAIHACFRFWANQNNIWKLKGYRNMTRQAKARCFLPAIARGDFQGFSKMAASKRVYTSKSNPDKILIIIFTFDTYTDNYPIEGPLKKLGDYWALWILPERFFRGGCLIAKLR